MILETRYSPERGAWWYAVADDEGDPVIVSPAVFPDEGGAAQAGLREMDNLARVIQRRTGANLSL